MSSPRVRAVGASSIGIDGMVSSPSQKPSKQQLAQPARSPQSPSHQASKTMPAPSAVSPSMSGAVSPSFSDLKIDSSVDISPAVSPTRLKSQSYFGNKPTSPKYKPRDDSKQVERARSRSRLNSANSAGAGGGQSPRSMRNVGGGQSPRSMRNVGGGQSPRSARNVGGSNNIHPSLIRGAGRGSGSLNRIGTKKSFKFQPMTAADLASVEKEEMKNVDTAQRLNLKETAKTVKENVYSSWFRFKSTRSAMNLKNAREIAKNPYRFIMQYTSDPDVDAKKHHIVIDENRIDILSQMIVHLVFLSVFCITIFVQLNLEQPYRTQYALKTVLTETELRPRSLEYFYTIRSEAQMWEWANNVLIPSLYQEKFYNDKPWATTDLYPQPFYFGDSTLMLGKIRIRQVRGVRESCSGSEEAFNKTQYLLKQEASSGNDGRHGITSLIENCYPYYQTGVSDSREDFSRGSEVFAYSNATDLEDDGVWQSPKTLIAYDAGGFVDDLPIAVPDAQQRVNQLHSGGFVDEQTRAVFFDFAMYNANNDQFLSSRAVFEMLPTGGIVPFLELIPAALLTDVRAFNQDNSSKTQLLKVITEFVVYAFIIAYLARASGEMARFKSINEYFANPWHLLDALNFFSFVMVIGIRVFWMLNAATFHYYVDSALALSELDSLKYVPIRLGTVYFSYGKTFFSFGTLLSFVKTFRFIGVSRRLAIFTNTIGQAVSDMGKLMVLLSILILAFSVSFHMAFGRYLTFYKDVPSSTISVLLVAVGEFDAQDLREANPVMGMILFTLYASLMVFVLLTMMLKVIEASYINTLQHADLALPAGEEPSLALHFRFAMRKLAYDYYWNRKIKVVLASGNMTKSIKDKITITKSGYSEKRDAIVEVNKAFRDAKNNSKDIEMGNTNTERRGSSVGVVMTGEEIRHKMFVEALELKQKELREAENLVGNEKPRNLIEDQKKVRDAIKSNILDDLEELEVDVETITDRMDMMARRSEILVKSAKRLLDSVLIMQEGNNGNGSGGGGGGGKQALFNKRAGNDAAASDSAPTSKPAQDKPPANKVYGKTGELFNLHGVAEPPGNLKVTDLTEEDMNDMNVSQLVLKKPEMSELMRSIDGGMVLGGDGGDGEERKGEDEEGKYESEGKIVSKRKMKSFF